VLHEQLIAPSSSYMRSGRQPQAQQICSGQQSSVQEHLLSSAPVNRIISSTQVLLKLCQNSFI